MHYCAIVLFLLFYGCAFALEIKSGSFENGAVITTTYTCDADNISPEFSWHDAPANTKSFALICEDPDSPSKIWSHWVVFNIPANKIGLEENIGHNAFFNDGTIQGVNDFGRTGYSGPCPPPGKAHRYFFRLYALDNVLLLDESSSREAVLGAMQTHILAQAQVFCVYSR